MGKATGFATERFGKRYIFCLIPNAYLHCFCKIFFVLFYLASTSCNSFTKNRAGL